MFDRLKAWIAKPVGLACLNAIFTAVIGVSSIAYTHHNTDVDRLRQAQLDAIARFEQSGANVVSSGGDFIAALNDLKDLKGAKAKVVDALTQQVLMTEQLRLLFPNDNFGEYLRDVSDFNTVVQKTSSPIEIGPWVQGFDRVLTQRTALTKDLYSAAGVSRS